MLQRAPTNRINRFHGKYTQHSARDRTESQNQLTPELAPSDVTFQLADDSEVDGDKPVSEDLSAKSTFIQHLPEDFRPAWLTMPNFRLASNPTTIADIFASSQ